jgi:hypothetical protein
MGTVFTGVSDKTPEKQKQVQAPPSEDETRLHALVAHLGGISAPDDHRRVIGLLLEREKIVGKFAFDSKDSREIVARNVISRLLLPHQTAYERCPAHPDRSRSFHQLIKLLWLAGLRFDSPVSPGVLSGTALKFACLIQPVIAHAMLDVSPGESVDTLETDNDNDHHNESALFIASSADQPNAALVQKLLTRTSDHVKNTVSKRRGLTLICTAVEELTHTSNHPQQLEIIHTLLDGAKNDGSGVDLFSPVNKGYDALAWVKRLVEQFDKKLSPLDWMQFYADTYAAVIPRFEAAIDRIRFNNPEIDSKYDAKYNNPSPVIDLSSARLRFGFRESEELTTKLVHERYKMLALEYHPDRSAFNKEVGDNKEAREEQMKQIHQAYDFLLQFTYKPNVSPL